VRLDGAIVVSAEKARKKLKWKPKFEDRMAVLTEFMKNLDKSLA
jgi:hypothetical protein